MCTSALLITQKLLTVKITTNWKILEELGTSEHLRNLYASQEETEPDKEQRTGSKLGKGVQQGCILSPAYLTYTQITSSEILGCMKHKLESRMPGEISITSDMQVITPLYRK